MIAISTTWNYKEDCSMREMLLAIKELGVNDIELGYNFTITRLEELLGLLDSVQMRVVSVHNFCPLPPQNPYHRFFINYYYLSSLDETERKLAVEYTKKTIDTAARLSAKIVIIHTGNIDMDTAKIKALMKLYCAGNSNSKEYDNLKTDILKLREEKKILYLEATRKSLEEIMPYAASKDIKIGLENRYYPNEIPNLEEAQKFLKSFANKSLVYWHDVGHSQALERLGFIATGSLLNKLSKYLFGFHLHDIRGLHDHLAPFTGDFDFSKLNRYLKNDKILKVIEAHHPATAHDIKNAIKHLAL